MAKIKKELEIVVISDVHLGTYGCHADELLSYLKSVKTKRLIINGDFIDGWQFSKKYFPSSHTKVLQRILKMSLEGTDVTYITGNHDEMLRKYSDIKIGNITLVDKLVVDIDGQSYWFFHGDVFDLSIKYAKWFAKLGGMGYDALIILNRWLNETLQYFGREKYSLSKNVKNNVKSAMKFINDFENVIGEVAIDDNYQNVVCGHIHEPVIKTIETQRGSIRYMNSGDWVENLSSLEYDGNEWVVHFYTEKVV